MEDMIPSTVPHDNPLKRCTKCGEEKPATPEFFYLEKRTKDGLYSICKVCRREHFAEYSKRPEVKEHRREHKAEYGREYYKRPEVKERMRIYYVAKYREHPEIAAERNLKDYRRAWWERPTSRDRKRTYRHKRRALIHAAQGSHTAQDILNQFKRQKGKCYWCSKKLTTYHVDHIVPLTRNGSNAPDNLVIACPTCNKRKGNKLPHEFYEGGRLL